MQQCSRRHLDVTCACGGVLACMSCSQSRRCDCMIITVLSLALQSCRFPSFQSILADQPGLTILTQVQHAADNITAVNPMSNQMHEHVASPLTSVRLKWLVIVPGLQNVGEQQSNGGTRSRGWRHPSCAHRHCVCDPPGKFRWGQDECMI